MLREILVCLIFSCLGNHQDADSAETLQDSVIPDCSQVSSSLLSGGGGCWVLSYLWDRLVLAKDLSLRDSFMFLHSLQRVLIVCLLTDSKLSNISSETVGLGLSRAGAITQGLTEEER